MAVSPPTTQRVPAWKRIGLKLAQAKDEAAYPSLDRAQEHRAASPPAAHDRSGDHARSSKRRKISPEPRNRSKPSATIHAAQSTSPIPQPKNGGTEDSVEPKLSTASTSIRRKSVTFTPETKQEDTPGNIAAFKSRTKSNLQAQPTDQERASPKHTTSEAIARPTSAKPSGFGGTKHTSTQGIPAFVKYLDQFQNDRSSWKFNKKKQNDLIKNQYDIDLLPPKYNEALVSYIRGLQGVKAAARLEDASQAVLEAITKDSDVGESLVNPAPASREGAEMEFAEARLNAYNQALQRSLERFKHAGAHRNEYDDYQFEEMRQTIERGKRAECILSELWAKDLQSSDASHLPTHAVANAAASNGATANIGEALPPPVVPDNQTSLQKEQVPKRRKRKLRTQGIDPVDSESENGQSRERGPITVHKKLSSDTQPVFKEQSDSTLSRKKSTKKIFDDDLLDQLFPKPKSYHDTAPKRKAGAPSKVRGFAYMHGTPADESGSEDE